MAVRDRILETLESYNLGKIRRAGGDNFIMCCWELPGEFCHRRVVAAWLRKHTGVLIEEFIPSHKRHAEWLRGLKAGGDSW